LPIPIRTFASPRDAIDALEASYQAFAESTHKNDWVSNGKAWYTIFPNHYKLAENGLARDVHVPDITYIAYGLCVDAVQRRGIKTKFLPRVTDNTLIYGGAENRYPSSTDVVYLPSEIQGNRQVAALLATEGFTMSPFSDGDTRDIYLRMSFRESPSKLKYIIVALYILWMQKYIRGVGPSGRGSDWC
jgi:hypothetical protein